MPEIAVNGKRDKHFLACPLACGHNL